MMCPICNREILEKDSDMLIDGIKRIASLVSPLGMVKGAVNVGRLVKTVFSELPKTDDFEICSRCKHYIVECPCCDHSISIGIEYPITKKHKCTSCGKEFYYVTDDGSHGSYY